MIPFDRSSEPAYFDERIRKPGNAWLRDHPDSKNPAPFWRRCYGDLRRAFRNLCAYSAMYIGEGCVDHFLSIRNRSLVYEWDNYRHSSFRMNSRKRNLDGKILDPLEVQEGWFRVILPSLQLVMTEAVPPHLRARAHFTLERLKLKHGEHVIQNREAWYEAYRENLISLEFLSRMAPLVARAVVEEKLESDNGRR